ncbi:MAG: molybdopterin synthase sulfur carrier subunit [Actinomycetota bacterium]|nr:molybdopterin synthase sulfur carrier subunit [Actinomycetota bacterium]
MAVVVLPSLLATEAGGRREFEVEAETLGGALAALPISDLLFDDHGELRRLVNVYVDGVDARDCGGLEGTLDPTATVRVVAAIAGG